MVDKYDMLLAAWGGKTGGMGGIIKYAKKKKRPIIVVDHFNLPDFG